jgi:Hemerythrin HHE cation binding domain
MGHDFALVLAVHDAVRRDLVRFVTLLGGNAPIGVERAAALGRQWDLLVGRVVEHERIEDDVLWPAARVAVPLAEQEPLDRMAAYHNRLTSALEVASAVFATGAVVGGGAPRHALADSVERAAVLADAQFGYEERKVLVLLDAWLPAADWDAFIAAARAPAGPLLDPVALPWLLDGSRPERTALLLGLLGVEHRDAYESQWKPAHRSRLAEAW